MVTKTIKGKEYTLYETFPTQTAAKKKAENLNGRLHIFTGLITETAVTKIAPGKYGVYTRKITE